jgi:hypothetical protein
MTGTGGRAASCGHAGHPGLMAPAWLVAGGAPRLRAPAWMVAGVAPRFPAPAWMVTGATLDPEDEETLLRPAPATTSISRRAPPAPPSISRRLPACRSKRGTHERRTGKERRKERWDGEERTTETDACVSWAELSGNEDWAGQSG